MYIENKSICIVASTLPVGFIAAQMETLNVEKIYVLSEVHELSYQSFRKKNPQIEIVRVPSGLPLQSLYFLFVLLKARISGTHVIFFHECCLPIFDLLLQVIKPRGYYFPQVTMSGFQEVEPEVFPRTRLYRLLGVLGVVDRFRFYRSPAVGDNESEYVMSIRSYPGAITSMDVSFSRNVISKCSSCGSQKTNKVLFIAGKSFVSDASQSTLFRSLIEAAHSRGYVCHIKDHPNPIYRLDLQIDGAVVLDPSVPVELMDKDYHLAVGVSSSALLGFDARAVSVVHMFDDMSPVDKSLCVNHFEEAFPGNKINYIRSLVEFEKLL
ncbi:MAG: hypothetical protein O9249_00300 [Burkholderiaceae bacterium]|nr:hypothetical protein [Burkholderiaceae bacterium]